MNANGSNVARDQAFERLFGQNGTNNALEKACQAEFAAAAKIAHFETAMELASKRHELAIKQVELEAERLMMGATALRNVAPVVQGVIGDPNTQLQQLTRVLVERGVDICQDHIEITLHMEE